LFSSPFILSCFLVFVLLFQVALIVNRTVAVKVPVLIEAVSGIVNVTTTEFGLLALQEPPPPVHADFGSVTTFVAELVLAVVKAHPVPSPAVPQL